MRKTILSFSQGSSVYESAEGDSLPASQNGFGHRITNFLGQLPPRQQLLRNRRSAYLKAAKIEKPHQANPLWLHDFTVANASNLHSLAKTSLLCFIGRWGLPIACLIFRVLGPLKFTWRANCIYLRPFGFRMKIKTREQLMMTIARAKQLFRAIKQNKLSV